MMTHDSHAVDHHASGDDLPFTDREIQELRAMDYQAGVAVVGLMLGIFSLGVVLYTIVLISVAA